jgi:OmcA/MtrC family decaheme c-type cytochrome
MTTSRIRLLALAVGLVAAGSASAATLSVYARMTGTNAVGLVATAAGSDASASISCATNAATGCVDADVTGTVFLDPSTGGTNATFVSWSGCATFAAWSATATYSAGAIVTSGGVRYQSLQAANLNHAVTDAAWWSVYAAANICVLDLSANKTVTANFRSVNQTLTAKTYPVPTATFTPAYGGTLAAPTTPAIAGCSTGVGGVAVGTCVGAAAYNSTVVVTATPNGASKVTGWTGCTTSSGNTCSVAMSAAKTVSATFGALYVPVKVAVSGAGAVVGAVPPLADAVNCTDAGGDCTGGANENSTITLTATAASGGTVTGFTGCTSSTLSGATGTCTVNVATAAVSVTATFKASGCAACHAVPPAAHSTIANANDCAACHSGYTASTVDPAKHMDGSVEVTCSQCHSSTSNPFHAANTVTAPNCVDCHPALLSGEHRDGSVDAPTLPADPPAGFGFNIDVVGFQPFGDTTYPRGYLVIKVTDNASPTPATLDLINLINTCGTYSGTATAAPCDGSNRTPRISIGEVLADGSFKPMLRGSTGAVASSETMATSRLTALGDGSYRYVPQYGFLSTVTYDAANSYRAVAYGGRYFKAAGVTEGFYNSDYLDLTGTGGVLANATVTDAKCNACHGKLTLHGMRRGVNICLTCHNPNLPLGSGNTDAFKWDLKNLAHKLHSGLNYDGINPMTGVQGTAWGSSLDASHIAQGPSHQTYFEGGGTATTSTSDDAVHQLPTEIQCGICHDTTKTDHLVASQAGCSSCHPMNWVTGAGHGASYPTVLAGETGHPHTDTECAGCHPSSGRIDTVWYTDGTPALYPVKQIHSALYEPKTMQDFNLYFGTDGTTKLNTVSFGGSTYPGVPEGRHQVEVDVTGFTVDGTSGKATIEFTVTLDGQPYQTLLAARTANLATNLEASADVLGGRWPTCAFTLAGPADKDYTVPATGSNNLSCGAADVDTDSDPANDGSAVVAVDAAAGKYKVTPTTKLNSATYAPGVYTLSYEMMYQRQAGSSATGIARKPFAAKPKFYAVTKTGTATAGTYTFGTTAPRRSVVSFDKCNNCHVQIGFHSNQGRQGPDYCAVCHNPMLDNSGRDRVKFAAAKDKSAYGALITGTVPTGNKVYLVESVSLNVFIHKIHMGSELPSVQGVPASPWVPEPGRIFYGATRSSFVGVDAATPPDITDLSLFGMPNPMGRCDQCHLDNTWGMPDSTQRAPVVRKFKVCAPTTPAWATEQWCNNTSSSGPTTVGTLYTPPVKAVCTSCHDSAATDAHADVFTIAPMTQTATEQCAQCHGSGQVFDANEAHRLVP